MALYFHIVIVFIYPGDVEKPIKLPLERPFYLYAYGSNECQIVKGAQVTKELVHFEVNTKAFHRGEGGAHPFQGGLGAKSHRLTYCYYTPSKYWSRKISFLRQCGVKASSL